MDRSRLPHNDRRVPRGRPAFASVSAKVNCAARHPRKRERGFTLIETVIALAIMATGLIAVAALVATSAYGSERSRYMSMASSLASEKIEDLMRYPSTDPQVTVTAGNTTMGRIQDPDAPTQSISGVTVGYADDVYISASGGQETNGGAITTVSVTTDTSGNTCYNVFYHQPNGTVSETCNATAPAISGSDMLTFHRRWMIESPVTINGNTINGVRRITVWVKLMNSYENPPVTFQVSIVRQ